MGGLGNGWLRMDRSVVGGFRWVDWHPPRGRPSHTLRSDRLGFFFGGRGLSFMGFNGLMLVGYGGGWADFHGL